MAAFDEQEYTKDFDLNIWKRLLPILARYKAVILAMITINGLTAVIDVAIPLFQDACFSLPISFKCFSFSAFAN